MSRPVSAHPPLPQPGSLVPPIYARLLRMLLQHADVDGDRVLAAAGLDWATLVTDDKRLGRDTIVRLAEGAMAATRRPWLGLDLGGGAPVSAHGALGYAVVTSRDLREAMLTLARYGTTRKRHDGVDVHRHPQRPHDAGHRAHRPRRRARLRRRHRAGRDPAL